MLTVPDKAADAMAYATTERFWLFDVDFLQQIVSGREFFPT